MSQTTTPPSEPPEGVQPLRPAPTYHTHPKQQAAIQSDARYKTLKWGRRAGKNITAVAHVIEYARQPWAWPYGRDDPSNAPEDEPVEIWWVGRSYDQAKKHGFEKVRAAVPDAWIAGLSRSEPYVIDFENGIHVEFRTFDHPETLQGSGVDGMIIDERDYMPDGVWHNDLDPMTLDYRAWVLWISKPVRPRSLFHQWYEFGQSDDHPLFYSSHATSADNPFIEENPEDKRGTVPDHVFRQQYLAELPDDGGQVFKKLGERLFTGEYPLQGDWNHEYGTGEVWADAADFTAPFTTGADFAQHRDYRVTITLDSEGRLVYFKRAQNESWRHIQSHLEGVAADYPGVVVPDATRDNKIIADLWHAGVNLQPTKFSPQRKVELIENLITAVETGRLTAPDDPRLDTIRTEFRIFEKEVTASGYTRYNAPENNHDDTVDAYALAVSALGAGKIATATANVSGDPNDSAERKAFKSSELGQAVEGIRGKWG